MFKLVSISILASVAAMGIVPHEGEPLAQGFENRVRGILPRNQTLDGDEPQPRFFGIFDEDWEFYDYVTETISSWLEQKTLVAAGFVSDPYPYEFGSDAFKVQIHDAECYVVVQATDSLSDWISNVQFFKSNYYYDGHYVGTAHSGFVDAYNTFAATGMHEMVNRLCSNVNHINFVGHSRGAAIATLLATSYHVHSRFTVDLFTFGAPRILEDASSDLFHRAFTQVRVMNNDDPVTATMGLYGKHFGLVVCLNCRETERDSSENGNPLNHKMTNYLGTIKKVFG
ncbi:hypothetical protein SARC_10750 [Sphaeroforma arctica JP610]|uniref:Fungal lipase-type domain-containing protein n=1 Tax=Sphaeroforma arctica JP610 TaxID=667725 RepID=A0A0L0FJ11_9EUKA|nr:hypothetical protein SARC_10750 [Sphaeroforma arctica JP610]KNC76769.1 hypothetical protein SARC_10750 [Sphaeroforma arctica JP610]|eukprot:XP_014150671.1 hypothetical protein SARC_10750 [Sphaeroforma arctica JP610]